jgi:hypothetical protein
VLKPAALLPVLVTLATGSVQSQASANSAEAVAAIRTALGGERRRSDGVGTMAVVRDIWRFTTSPSPGDSAVSIVRGYGV